MNAIRTTAAAFAALALLTTSVAPAAAGLMVVAKNYDGGWSVLVVTEKGTCDRSYRYPVRIESGAVGSVDSTSSNLTGQVGVNGFVTVTMSHGDTSATGIGHMSDHDGAGTWTAASGGCSGTWTAERRS